MISAVPESVKNLKGRHRVSALSRLAREIAGLSSMKSGVSGMRFEKDETGVPRPFGRIFWSISHKPGLVGGVVARTPVGIDIETMRPVSGRLFERVVAPEEMEWFDEPDRDLIFFRTFTAKEAVLKRFGRGIESLSRVRVTGREGKEGLILAFENEKIRVVHFYLDDHIASVTKELPDIHWTVEKSTVKNNF